MSPPSHSKTLVLVRHATAGWETGQADFDRRLLPHGEAEARALGQWFHASGFSPDAAYTSAAPRARQTLDFLADEWPVGTFPPPHVAKGLYEASAGQILDLLQCLDDRFSSVVLVAHNPGITHVSALLLGEPALWELPPAGLLWVECAVESWAQLAPGCADLRRRWQP